MKRPLYKLANGEPSYSHEKSNAGLWFDKFCNQWDAKWSLTAKDSSNPKLNWIKTVTSKKIGDADLLNEHQKRLAEFATKVGGQTFVFKTTSRLTTGLGREHPIENGFTWHPALGVPYLLGSSVKGLVRAWATTWGNPQTANDDRDRIFGNPKSEGIGSVIFFDAIPTEPIQMKADVMTPHYGEYYRDDSGKTASGDWLSPVPIHFLTVAPDAKFQFAIAPRTSLQEDLANCETAAKWLEEALLELGAGAKTAVGYGRFERDKTVQTEAERKEQSERAAQKEAAFAADQLLTEIGALPTPPSAQAAEIVKKIAACSDEQTKRQAALALRKKFENKSWKKTAEKEWRKIIGPLLS